MTVSEARGGRGRPPRSGRKTRETHDKGRITVRPTEEERRLLVEGARLDGEAEDGRSGGEPALAPWLLRIGLERARQLVAKTVRRIDEGGKSNA